MTDEDWVSARSHGRGSQVFAYDVGLEVWEEGHFGILWFPGMESGFSRPHPLIE